MEFRGVTCSAPLLALTMKCGIGVLKSTSGTHESHMKTLKLTEPAAYQMILQKGVWLI